MNNFSYTIWILLLPLLSFLVVGLTDYFRGKKGWSPKLGGLIATCSNPAELYRGIPVLRW